MTDHYFDSGRATSELLARISEVETALRTEISRLEATLRAEISEVEATLRTEISRLEATLRAEIKDVRTELTGRIDKLETRMNWISGVIVTTQVGLFAMVAGLYLR
jgi:hypothetical protein